MIKIFATDMDKTLLRSDSSIPHQLEPTLERIERENLRLLLASGRALESMMGKVGSLVDRFDFISNNGALVHIQGKTYYKSTINREIVRDLIIEGRKYDETSIILISPDNAYVDLHSDEHGTELKEYYPDFKVSDNLLDIDDDIIKVTYLNTHSMLDIYFDKIKPRFTSEINIIPSGDIWVDAMNKDVNKGNALKKVLDYYNVSPDEVIAFGDYHNDIELLKLVGKSYAVANAHPDVIDIADEVIQSNDENAVLNKINEYLDAKSTE